jgi:hypothetical protein
MQAVDSDGDAAPIPMRLTTGTIVARNDAGVVVSISGTPRSGDGLVRLVGIDKIPTGFNNGAEEQLVVVEILASLRFGTSLTQSGFGQGGASR